MHTIILLVDDDPVMCMLIPRLLHEADPDYEVLIVPDGATALSVIAQRPVALIITDLRIPNMDGVKLTAAVKAVMPHCPIILMTGYSTADIQRRAEAAGANVFLPKPFPLNDLVTIVKTALADHRVH